MKPPQGPPEITTKDIETTKTYKIEHFPGVDVIVNLNSSPADYNLLLEIIKDIPKNTSSVFSIYSFERINKLLDENGKYRFFIKFKRASNQSYVDFLKGRSHQDYLSERARKDFDQKARYAHTSILSEMTLSTKIKNLVSSNQFQEVAGKYGFTDITFAEPIIAIVIKRRGQKYLVYRFIDENTGGVDPLEQFPQKMVQEIDKMFRENGIAPHDLREYQFMETTDEKGHHLYLIDIEAYTEEEAPN